MLTRLAIDQFVSRTSARRCNGAQGRANIAGMLILLFLSRDECILNTRGHHGAFLWWSASCAFLKKPCGLSLTQVSSISEQCFPNSMPSSESKYLNAGITSQRLSASRLIARARCSTKDEWGRTLEFIQHAEQRCLDIRRNLAGSLLDTKIFTKRRDYLRVFCFAMSVVPSILPSPTLGKPPLTVSFDNDRRVGKWYLTRISLCTCSCNDEKKDIWKFVNSTLFEDMIFS